MPKVTFDIPAAFLNEAQAASLRMKGIPLKDWIIRETKDMVLRNRKEVALETAAQNDTDAEEISAVNIV